MRVSFLGLGNMGLAIAECLHASAVDVLGFDIDAGARTRAEQRGVTATGNLADALRERDVIFSCLPNADIVRKVWCADDGVIAGARVGSTLIELSTIDPDTMRGLAALAAQKGLVVLDCPISGSPELARKGEIVLIVGGVAAAIELHKELLSKFSKAHFVSGDVGTAKAVKIVNNMMSVGNVLIAAEAFSIGCRAGVDPERLLEILMNSGGRSDQFNRRFPKAIRGDFDPGFSLDLAVKDMRLAVELGRRTGVPTPSAAFVTEMAAIGLASGLHGRDMVALLQMYTAWSSGNESIPA